MPDATRQAMLALHRRYYCGVRTAAFLRDLAAKDRVILLHAADGRLAGFSTALTVRLTAADRACRILFSGDTVVDEPYRHSPALAGAFGHLMLHLMATAGPGEELYWFLISKGFRTYRFLPVFFRQFCPRYDGACPPHYPAVLADVARQLFPRGFDPGSGVVRIPGRHDRLRARWAEVGAGRAARDPHVAFFLRANPGFGRGDELACLAAISRENLTALAWRAIRATPVDWEADPT